MYVHIFGCEFIVCVSFFKKTFTFQNEGLKLLYEFLEDIDTQLKQIIDAKSVHDCLFSPQRLTNSLSQDYFLLLGRLSNCEAGLMILKKLNILQRSAI